MGRGAQPTKESVNRHITKTVRDIFHNEFNELREMEQDLETRYEGEIKALRIKAGTWHNRHF